MTDQNSYAEFILGAYSALLKDCALHYPALTKEFNRDYSRLSSAIERHGVKFALDTMPEMRKHFDKCLASRRLTPSNLCHFGTVKKEWAIPRLFRGLFLRVFDSQGALKHDADEHAVRLLRQLLGVVKKMKLQCSTSDRCKAVAEFFRTDSEVRLGTLNWADQDGLDTSKATENSFTELSVETRESQGVLFPEDPTPEATLPFGLADTLQRTADYVSSKLGSFDPEEWRFKHGPGAVADRKIGSYKYEFDNWPARLERVFPYSDFALANYGVENTASYASRPVPEFLSEHPAELCAVPKTITGPRLIAEEPVALQWCQQAIKDYLYTRVSESILSNFIDFRRQDKNGSLALEASQTGELATIDLSSASDRISLWLVERVFRRAPTLLEALDATRSVWIHQDIDKKSPKYYVLRKFSTMGNATTFPVQSLVFLTVALGCVLHKRGWRVSDKTLSLLGDREVRVFGDDIIVPADCAELVADTLEALGLRVNTNKTFLSGNFRESCGVDAFNGHDVTVTSILDVPDRTKPGSIVSNVDVHHNLCSRDYVNTAAFIQKTVARIVKDTIRFVSHGSGAFGWSDRFGTTKTRVRTRYGKNLHRPEVYCLKTKVVEYRLPPKGNPGLLQYFTEAPKVVTSGISSLGYMRRRPKVGLTLGWVGLS